MRVRARACVCVVILPDCGGGDLETGRVRCDSFVRCAIHLVRHVPECLGILFFFIFFSFFLNKTHDWCLCISFWLDQSHAAGAMVIICRLHANVSCHSWHFDEFDLGVWSLGPARRDGCFRLGRRVHGLMGHLTSFGWLDGS
jgi:hypothetical protein